MRKSSALYHVSQIKSDRLPDHLQVKLRKAKADLGDRSAAEDWRDSASESLVDLYEGICQIESLMKRTRAESTTAEQRTANGKRAAIARWNKKPDTAPVIDLERNGDQE